MKYYLFLIAFVVGLAAHAQQPYKYVIIPTYFYEFGKGINPYGLSASVQAELSKKSIKSVFESQEVPEDYCEALTVRINKLSSFLSNKVNVELRDCMNQVVWSHEGVGDSKEFREGLGEAVADALRDLDRLPENKTVSGMLKKVKPQLAEEVAAPGKTEKEGPAPRNEMAKTASVTHPDAVNPYHNGKYLLDVLPLDNGDKELRILNGAAPDYKAGQKIATLSPAGLDDVYTIRWIQPDGSEVAGVAKLTPEKLEISLKGVAQEEVIVLYK